MPHPNTDPYRAKLIKLVAHRIPEVSDRTIRNWIDGDTVPTPMMRERFDIELAEAKRTVEVYHPGLIQKDLTPNGVDVPPLGGAQ